MWQLSTYLSVVCYYYWQSLYPDTVSRTCQLFRQTRELLALHFHRHDSYELLAPVNNNIKDPQPPDKWLSLDPAHLDEQWVKPNHRTHLLAVYSHSAKLHKVRCQLGLWTPQPVDHVSSVGGGRRQPRCTLSHCFLHGNQRCFKNFGSVVCLWVKSMIDP